MKPIHAFAASLLLAATPAAQTAAQEGPGEFEPVTDEMLQNPEAGDWLMFRRTANAWGYSPLEQVNRDNVSRLALAWSRPLGPGIQEGTPLVYRGVMYFPSPSDLTEAFDAATGDLLWSHARQEPADLREFLPFPSINRNLAIYGNLVIDNGLDDTLYALDARSGELAWETRVLDYRKNASQQSSGPIIGGGKVISGRGCQPNTGPVACVLTAHDALTGKELWRTPTIEVPPEGGEDSWGDYPYENRWHVGSWLVPSWDPVLNLAYFGTSVTWPAPKFVLGGNDQKHLYHNSTLVLDADTGEIAWYFQHLVDHWDLDHVFERMLVDTAVTPDPAAVKWINPALQPGEVRKVMTGIPGKTGIVYTLDRATGEFLWATPTIFQNVVQDIDPATGAATVNPDKEFHQKGDKRHVCPNTDGGKNWPAGAYSPKTNAMYFPMQNTCMNATVVVNEPIVTDPMYGLVRQKLVAPDTDKVGSVWAISAETGRVLWKHEQRAATGSLVATGGGLLFGGDVNGRFRALDMETGEVLWEVNLGSQVTGYPVTYAVGGRQYVAVSTGSAFSTVGLLSLTPELRPGGANNLFVFALPAED